MKKSKRMLSLLLSLMAIVSISFFVVSCDDDDDPTPGDNTELVVLITECQTLHDGATEGTAIGFYAAGSKAVFQTTIDAAKVVADNAKEIQTVIDVAEANLNAAKVVFENTKIQDVSTDGLVAQWLFNGNATDYTGNGFDGTTKTGHSDWGAGTPSLTADRFGNAEMAYYFNQGANIEVPYATALNPGAMSLSWWVYMEAQDNNDYMISMNRWNCYKVNLQTIDRIFFTTKADDPVNTGEFIWSDRDHAGDGLVAETWYHLVVSFGAGHMKFYIDGVMEKDWDNVPNSGIANIANDPINLTFGQDLPTDIYADDGTYNLAWGGYFKGKLDDIRLYNRVLSDSEVSSIYTLEKP